MAKLVFPHSSIFLPEKRTHFQLNLCQHGRRVTGVPPQPRSLALERNRVAKACNMLRPTMLGYDF